MIGGRRRARSPTIESSLGFLTTMTESIQRIEALPLRIQREVPYLGPLEDGVTPTEEGYFVRPGNRSVYSTADHSVLVKVVTADGAVGWGECVTVVAPQVVVEIIEQLVGPLVIGRDPLDVVAIHEDLYDACRVRGYFGGFYLDALAGLDIALWDLRGKLTGLPICKLLGAERSRRIPAYVSGLPGRDRAERAALARRWVNKGFRAVKFAAVVAHEGEAAEMQAIREAVGSEIRILADLHWRYTAPEAIQIIQRLEEFELYLVEAPVQPEDVAGLARVARAVKTPVGIGEELRTVFEFRPRFLGECMAVIQPEVGRTGITEFWDICRMARAFHCKVMPHASIGIGIFQAASLQASAALPHVVYHEYQHSIFDKNLRYIRGGMRCEAGYFYLPEGPGLGVEPDEGALADIILPRGAGVGSSAYNP